MPDIITVALIAGGSSLVTAALSFVVTAWLGNRKATSEEVQLGLNALRDGLATAVSSVETLTIKLARLEAQATLVLTENNRFRIMHGEVPALSLESFKPLNDEAFDRLLGQLSDRK